MRNRVLWLAFALMATAVFGASLVAQPPPDRRPPGPGGRGGPGGPGGGPLERAVDDLKISSAQRETAQEAVRAFQDNMRRMTDLSSASLLLKVEDILSTDEFKKLQEATDKVRIRPPEGRRLATDDVVERILSFDKNNDGKITKDELPERMQFLIEKGDTNKDGALDKDEIKKLAVELAKDNTLFGGGPGGGPGGRGGPGGPGGRGGPLARGGPGSGLSLVMIERAVDDLKLPEAKKETTSAAIKLQKEDARKLTELVRAELLLQMSEILNEEDFKKFKVTVERQPGVGERPSGPPPFRDGPPPGRGGPPPFRGGPRP